MKFAVIILRTAKLKAKLNLVTLTVHTKIKNELEPPATCRKDLEEARNNSNEMEPRRTYTKHNKFINGYCVYNIVSQCNFTNRYCHKELHLTCSMLHQQVTVLKSTSKSFLASLMKRKKCHRFLEICSAGELEISF